MSNNKQSEEEINKIDVQSAADQQENTNADSKKANWLFGAVGNIVKQHLDREGIFWMFCLGVKMLRNQAPVFSE